MSQKNIQWSMVLIAMAGLGYYRFYDNFFLSIGNYLVFPLVIILEVIFVILYWKKSKEQDKKITDEEKRTRSLVITGFVLLALFFLFKWEFIYRDPVGDRLLGLMGIPAWSNEDTGLHYTGIVSIVFLMLGLVSLHVRYSGKMILIFFLVVMALPPNLFANVYQSTFAEGIYALEYNQDQGSCQYDTNDSGILVGKCMLSFENHGRQPLTFKVSLDQKLGRNGFDVLKLIHLKDRQLEIDPLEQKMFEITFRQSLQSSRYESVSGTASMFDVTIIGDQYTRN